MNTPLIRIELESMKQTMIHAFSSQMFQLDTQFKKALEEACHPDNIDRILTESANSAIKEVIEEEINNFFRNGDGRKFVAEKVREKLGQEL